MKKLKIDKIDDLIVRALDIIDAEKEKSFDDTELDNVHSALLSAHDALVNYYFYDKEGAN